MGRVVLILARVLLTPLFFLLIGGVFVTCMAADAVDRHLFNADFYLAALDDNDAYARVLDEFLLEVEQAETTQRIVAHTDTTTAEMSALIREIVQVNWLREQAEANFRAFFAYLRHDTDELILVLELQPVLDRMQPALSSFLIDYLGEIETHPVDSYEEFRSELDGLMDTIRNGDAVISLPTYELTDAERAALLDEIFAPGSVLEDSDARAKVDDALKRQDTAAALIAVVDELLSVRLDEATAELREKLDSQNRLDLVDQIADDEGKTREEMLERFEDVRRGVGLVTGRGRLAGGAVLLLLAALLGLLYLPGRLWPFAVPGVVFVLWAGAGLLGWLAYNSAVPAFAHNRVIDNETELSDSGVSLLADVAETLVSDVADSVLRPSLALLVLGVAAIVAGVPLESRRRSGAVADPGPAPAELDAAAGSSTQIIGEEPGDAVGEPLADAGNEPEQGEDASPREPVRGAEALPAAADPRDDDPDDGPDDLQPKEEP